MALGQESLSGPAPPVGTENRLLEGHFEDKTFAQGYGEFRCQPRSPAHCAAPADARTGGVPAELKLISHSTAKI